MARYWTGAHTKHRLRFHLVWIPKYRKRVSIGKSVKVKLLSYRFRGLNNGSQSLSLGKMFHHKTKTQEEKITAEKKIAQNRMTLLQLAERLRNVSEACRRRGVSRSQFYEYKRAF